MPSLSQATLRAWLYIVLAPEGCDGPDYPAGELSYRSEEVQPPGRDPNDPLIRFNFYLTHEGVEKLLCYKQYALAGHSRGHWEREFIDSVAAEVGQAYKTAKERFLKLQEIVQAAGYPV